MTFTENANHLAEIGIGIDRRRMEPPPSEAGAIGVTTQNGIGVGARISLQVARSVLACHAIA
jgi:hypothetical protein